MRARELVCVHAKMRGNDYRKDGKRARCLLGMYVEEKNLLDSRVALVGPSSSS